MREAFPVDHPVVSAVVDRAAEGWRGTVSQLHALFELLRVADLPPDGQRLGDRLRASELVLADAGVRVRRSRARGVRMLSIERVEPAPSAVEVVEEPAPVPAVAEGLVRLAPEDRVAPWAAGCSRCPRCLTELRDQHLVANRRADGLKWYPDLHTARACRYESAQADRMEERVVQVASGRGWWQDAMRSIDAGPPW